MVGCVGPDGGGNSQRCHQLNLERNAKENDRGHLRRGTLHDTQETAKETCHDEE